MAGKNIAKIYASSLVEISLKKDALSQVEEEVQAISGIFTEDADLFRFFTTPGISKSRKKKIISDVFGGQIGKYTINLLNTLIDNGREAEIIKIYDEMKEEIDLVKNIQKVTVVSSTDLDSKMKDTLVAIFKDKLKKEISLNQQIDKEILGGIIIKYDDLVIDGSISKDLKKLKGNLLYSKIGSEAVYED